RLSLTASEALESTALRWSEVLVAAPSPLAGEGSRSGSAERNGGSQLHPSPILCRRNAEQPSPARGEGTMTLAQRAAMRLQFSDTVELGEFEPALPQTSTLPPFTERTGEGNGNGGTLAT